MVRVVPLLQLLQLFEEERWVGVMMSILWSFCSWALQELVREGGNFDSVKYIHLSIFLSLGKTELAKQIARYIHKGKPEVISHLDNVVNR